VALLLAACAGDDEVAGGAADLPGPVPSGVEFVDPPESALPAPPFTAELLDGTGIRAEELWAERPFLFVFTASYCDRCREIHRAAAEAVDGFGGAAGLLGILGEDDASGGADYAEELDLGHPVAVAAERTWLNYAAREPGLVVLVSKGGEVVRGWPTGVDGAGLREALDALIER
jgi:cytochrome c biogenesis protein CcmG/thiol:disulfide interchange protein DsbE